MSETSARFQTLEFKGSGSEYFGIWIVNTLLTIITLGIYSAWAKVRTKKYFYGNTYLDGHNFDYHADPLRILLGRALLLVVFLAFQVGAAFSVFFPLVSGAFVLILGPWFVVRSLVFNFNNSSYRKVRFGYDPDYSLAYNMLIKGILITFITLYLGFGYLIYQFQKLKFMNARFGKVKFAFEGDIGPFVMTYLKFIFMTIVAYLLALALIIGPMFLLTQTDRPSSIYLTAGIGFFSAFVAMIFASAYMMASVSILIAQSVKFPGVNFKSTVGAWDLGLLFLWNMVLALCTLGLAYPWIRVGLIKYYTSHIHLSMEPGVFDQVERGVISKDGAVSDAAIDFWDIDIGF